MNTGCHHSCGLFYVVQDAVDNDLKPLMEQSVGSRDEAKLKEVWQRIYSHLFDHKSWETSQDGSLYGTPSASSNLVGARKKKFAQVQNLCSLCVFVVWWNKCCNVRRLLLLSLFVAYMCIFSYLES